MSFLKEGAVLVLDTETNALRNPTTIHVICTRDEAGETQEFRQPVENSYVRKKLFDYLSKFETFTGHNFIQYDLVEALDRLLPGHPIRLHNVVDTLVVSRLFRYNQAGGHSLEAWGERVGAVKEGKDIKDWSRLTDEMIRRCHSDTDINLRIFKKYKKYLQDPKWAPSLYTEHMIARVCKQMSQDGFAFNKAAALEMKADIESIVDPITASLKDFFPPTPVFIREITPRVTKHGTLNRNDFRWFEGDDMTIFTGDPFSLIEFREFNPGSNQQMIDKLFDAGWKPVDKTKGYLDALKERPANREAKAALNEKLQKFARYGWKVNETNLATLPDTADPIIRQLAKRIILTSRLSDLEEWLALAEDEGDETVVHGEFSPIGAWTHRLSHSKPNLANVPVAKRTKDDNDFETLINDYNDGMRKLWIPRKGCRLVGTDADGIQMRIFADLVGDPRLIEAIVSGSKENQTDIHSLHKKFLGEVCKSRDSAKTFIYAWLLGAGIAKVAEILSCTPREAKESVDNFIKSYPGLKELKSSKIPYDAARGYFVGYDGRLVIQDSEHHMLAGYLQNGEAVIMKGACLDWQAELKRLSIPFKMVTWPHDEWQTEIEDDDEVCRIVQQVQIQAIRDQGPKLGFKLPLDGESKWGYSWKETH